MASKYSVAKRGKVYYLRHRITPDRKQVSVSLKTPEQREAYRMAKQLVREAEFRVALSQRTPAQEAEFEAWHERFQTASDATAAEMTAELLGGLKRVKQHLATERDKERAQQQRAADARRAKQEQEQAELQRDLTNPRLDAFWTLGETKAHDKGLFLDWCREGNRSPNTVIAYRTVWKRLRGYYPEIQRLGDITPELIKGFIAKCKKDPKRGTKPLSQSGVTQYLIVLQGIFSSAIKEGWFQGTNPVNVSWQQKRDKVAKFLSKDEVERLLAHAKATDTATYLFIAVAVHTGMRKDEVANLRWEDIDFERKIITLQAKKADDKKGIQEFQLKSRKARTVPLKEALTEILAPFRKPEGYIIESKSGKEIKRSRWSLPSHFGTVQELAGVTCNPHMLRHTFASWAATQGVSIYKISEWLGHSTVQLTQDTYAHLQAYDRDIDRF